jgi:hypothetical protein
MGIGYYTAATFFTNPTLIFITGVLTMTACEINQNGKEDDKRPIEIDGDN